MSLLKLDLKPCYLSVRASGSGAEADGGDGERAEVCVVPSELRAYGVWDAAGSGLMELRDSSSSVVFFALSDAQARLLHTELSALHEQTAGNRNMPQPRDAYLTHTSHPASFFSPALPVHIGAPDWPIGRAAGSHLSIADGDDGSEERTPVPGNSSVPGGGAETGSVPPSRCPLPHPAGKQSNQSGKPLLLHPAFIFRCSKIVSELL